MDRTKVWLLVGVFLLVVALVIAGIVQKNINLTAVALALVSYMGWLTKSLIDTKDDPP